MMAIGKHIVNLLRTASLAAALFLVSCASNRQIPAGGSRLIATRINVDTSAVQPSQLTPYLKQRGEGFTIFGINPFKAEAVLFDPVQVKNSKVNMTNYLEREGWYGSTVKDSVHTHGIKTKVDYDVKLGNRYRISEIKYNVEDSLLATCFDTTRTLIKRGDFLSATLLERETQRIVRLFRNRGFFNFNDGYISFVADTLLSAEREAGRTAELTLNIRRYMRNSSPLTAADHRRFKFGKITVFPMLKPVGDYISKQDSLLMVPTDTIPSHNVHVAYSGSKPLVTPGLINRMNLMVPDSPYSDAAVTASYNRLSAIPMFGTVNMTTGISPEDSTKVDVDVQMESTAIQGFKFTFEGSVNSSALLGISPGISYYHKNVFGSGEVLNVGFSGSFQFKVNSPTRSNEFNITTGLSLPRFTLFGDRIFRGTSVPTTEISLSYNYQQRPEYRRNIFSSTFGLAWNKRGRYFFNVNLIQANIVKIYDMSDEFYNELNDPFLYNSYHDHFDLGMGGTFMYTTDNSIPHNRSYFYLRASMDISGNLMSLFNSALSTNADGERMILRSPYSQYARTELSAVYTWKFGRNNKSALAARALFGIGVAYGNSLSLPFEKLFWSGGPYGLRGWLARSVGPGSAQRDYTFAIANQTGDLKMEANLEYRFPLFSIFESAIFVDAGNVWRLKISEDDSLLQPIEKENDNRGLFRFNDFYNNIALDWGTGLRINLGFTLIRFDVGFKTYEPDCWRWSGPKRWFKSNGYTIQFGIDYPF